MAFSENLDAEHACMDFSSSNFCLTSQSPGEANFPLVLFKLQGILTHPSNQHIKLCCRNIVECGAGLLYACILGISGLYFEYTSMASG